MPTSDLFARLAAPWVIDARSLDILQHRLALAIRGEIAPSVASGKKGSPLSPSRRGTVSIIPVHGVLVQRTDELSDLFGEVGYEDITRAVRNAVDDPEVDAIVLHFSSPGGMAYGAPECAAAIAGARRVKKCIAVVDPLCASGAYWIASQCSEVVVTPSGECGSIGVYTMHQDHSKRLEELGVKVTPVSVGKYKTATNPYEPLSEDGRAQIEKGIGAIYEQFIKDVARGRGVTAGDVRDGFAEGGVASAAEAVKLKMADRVETFPDVVARVFREMTDKRVQLDAAVSTRWAMLERSEAEAKKAKEDPNTKMRLELAKRQMLLDASESAHQQTTQRIAVQTRASDVNSIVAHHEAGHAVAAWALGLRSMTVSMVPNDTSSGRVATNFLRLDPFARAVFCLAGKEAEALSGHTATWATNTQDEADARAACPAHQLALARERARALVDTHRLAVKFVAGELLEHHTVDEKTVGLALGS